MSAKVQATARVRVTIDVLVDEPWGAEQTETASREALSKVRNMLDERKGIAARIVGEPVVEVIVGQVSR